MFSCHKIVFCLFWVRTVHPASYSSELGPKNYLDFDVISTQNWRDLARLLQLSWDCDEQSLYPQCLYVCVFAYASKMHPLDVCTQSLINVCDNYQVGKHLHAHSVICGLFGLAVAQSWLAGFSEDSVRWICLTGHSKIRSAWLKTTSPSFHLLLASVV